MRSQTDNSILTVVDTDKKCESKIRREVF